MRPNSFEPQPPSMRTIASICRCASPQEHANRAIETAMASERESRASAERAERDAQAKIEKRYAELAAQRPDPDAYQIEKVERVGAHLVMQVRYTSCKACAFEGLKTLVFLDASEAMALKWRCIDPHFRQNAKDHATAHPKDAPSPAARFPGSPAGWHDAMEYARRKPAGAK